jgi:type IV secretory pathway VirB2 component (pilin)
MNKTILGWYVRGVVALQQCGSRLPPTARALLILAVVLAWGAAASAGTLRWDAGLTEIGNTITGRVAAGVGVIGIGIVGVGAATNADMGGAARGIVGVAIILGMVLAGKTFVSSMGLTGALLP